MLIKVNKRVKFGSGGMITGTVVGHGTMMSRGNMLMTTYAIRLDEEFRGYIQAEADKPGYLGSYVSTLVVCTDGVVKI